MRPVETYQPYDPAAFVDKHPVLVDGNTYEAFSDRLLLESIREEQSRGQVPGDESYMILGTPRLMSRTKLIALTMETRENILVLGRAAEQMCMASLLTSAIRSYLAQGKDVQVWAYGKNSMYRACKEAVWAGEPFDRIVYAEGMDAVCDSIRGIRKSIESRQTGDALIVLIGLDRICSDFDFVEGAGGASDDPQAEQAEQRRRTREAELRKQGALVSTPQDRMRHLFAARWDADAVRKRGESAGVAESEMDAYIRKERAALAAAIQKEVLEAADKPEENATPKEERTTGAYQAGADLQYIVKQGSRQGYHFLLALNSYADLKPTALKLDWFRHRLAFQLSAEDSRELFTSKIASTLPEHICQYYDTMDRHSFRPYLHAGISWDGWTVDENGDAVNPFAPVGE